jgi:hypothetical protein
MLCTVLAAATSTCLTKQIYQRILKAGLKMTKKMPLSLPKRAFLNKEN